MDKEIDKEIVSEETTSTEEKTNAESDLMLDRILELIGTKRGAAKDLMDAIGLPSNTVSEWKTKRLKSYPKYAAKIADYYNVSLDWLSGKTDIKNVAPQRSDAIPSNLIPYSPKWKTPYRSSAEGLELMTFSILTFLMLLAQRSQGLASIAFPFSSPYR